MHPDLHSAVAGGANGLSSCVAQQNGHQSQKCGTSVAGTSLPGKRGLQSQDTESELKATPKRQHRIRAPFAVRAAENQLLHATDGNTMPTGALHTAQSTEAHAQTGLQHPYLGRAHQLPRDPLIHPSELQETSACGTVAALRLLIAVGTPIALAALPSEPRFDHRNPDDCCGVDACLTACLLVLGSEPRKS